MHFRYSRYGRQRQSTIGFGERLRLFFVLDKAKGKNEGYQVRRLSLRTCRVLNRR